MAIIDTSFLITIEEFSEIPEKEIKVKDMELNRDNLTDEINPTFLDGCCGETGGGCCGGCC